MANFYNISLLMIVGFLVLVFVPALASAEVTPEAAYGPESSYSPEPSYDETVIPPEPRPGYFRYLHTCAADITDQFCAFEILRGLDGKGPVSKNCCKQVVEMGRECHLALVEAIRWVHVKPSAPYLHKYLHLMQGLDQTAPVVWDQCVKSVANPPLPSLD